MMSAARRRSTAARRSTMLRLTTTSTVPLTSRAHSLLFGAGKFYHPCRGSPRFRCSKGQKWHVHDHDNQLVWKSAARRYRGQACLSKPVRFGNYYNPGTVWIQECLHRFNLAVVQRILALGALLYVAIIFHVNSRLHVAVAQNIDKRCVGHVHVHIQRQQDGLDFSKKRIVGCFNRPAVQVVPPVFDTQLRPVEGVWAADLVATMLRADYTGLAQPPLAL